MTDCALAANQLDMFSAANPPNDPVIGMAVQLPDLCAKCGNNIALIGPGKGAHAAALQCRSCNAHRGWMSHHTYKFITEIANKFGAPVTPIVIRRGCSPAAEDANARS